jgi:hypothetical protein
VPARFPEYVRGYHAIVSSSTDGFGILDAVAQEAAEVIALFLVQTSRRI